MAISNEKIRDFASMYVDLGPKKCQEVLGLKLDTFKRYVRQARKEGVLNDKKIALAKISDTLTIDEIKRISTSERPDVTDSVALNFEGSEYKFAHMTDLHFGSIYTKPEMIEACMKKAEDDGCQAIMLSGDITDGLSNRKDHVYVLSHVGYEAQRDHAVEILSKSKLPLYMISGNHDLYYKLSGGANIVKDICDRIPNATFLGDHEGSVFLNGGVEIRLWHGLDGASYAHSYRLQKVVESLYGGDKPNVLLAGHTHKMGYFFDRNVHIVSGGCLQYQSKWMRMKRLQAHVGFWKIRTVINDRGIVEFNPTFLPFYE